MQYVSWRNITSYTKHLAPVFCFILISCHQPHADKFLQPFSAPEEHQTTIDLLVKSISSDTAALENYLILSISTHDKYAEMIVYKELGAYYSNSYAYKKAIDYHLSYLETARSSENALHEIKALNYLAQDFAQIRAYDASAYYYFKALSLINRLQIEVDSTVHSEKAKTMNGIGEIYFSVNQPDEAMNYFRDAIRPATYSHNLENLATTVKNIGTVYEWNKQYDSAHIFYERALDYHIIANSFSGINNCFWHIGNVYMVEGDYKNASVYLESAYNSLLPTSDQLNKLNVTLSLGELNIHTGNYFKSEYYLQNALTVAEKYSLSGYLEKCYFYLSELPKLQNKNALSMKERSISEVFAKTFNKEKVSNKIMIHRLNYEKQIKNEEMSVLTIQHQIKEEKLKKTLNATFRSITLLIFIIFIIILYFRLKRKKGRKILQMEEIKSEFYTKISQELMTPAGIITGLAERLRKTLQVISTDYAIEMDILSRQSENLFLLINEINSLNYLQEENKQNKVVNANIISYLKYLYECFYPLAETKKIDYVFFGNVSEICIDYWPEYMRMVMHTLLYHATTNSPEQSNITVSVLCDRKKKYYTIEVFYNGTKHSQDDHSQSFFEKSNKSTAYSYIGIKLTLIKQLIEKMKGTIVVKDYNMNNAAFILNLPIQHCHFPQTDESVTIRKQITDNKLSLVPTHTQSQIENNDRPIVLIVGENKDMNFYLTSILKDKYVLLTEIDGKNAIKTAQEKIPDLIISDVLLPLVDGYQLCKEIKNQLSTNHIPIILLTLIHSKEGRIRGIAYGADAFLSTPVYEEELLAVMEQLLSTRRQLREKYSPFMRMNTPPEEKNMNGNNVNLDFLQRVTNLIYKELTNTENIIEKISSEVCLSTSQLNRKMKALSGLTTSNYILKTRLNKAKKMLTLTHKPIGEIAMECGFNDFAYFSRSFKKEFGMTPTSFQRIPTRNKITNTPLS